MQNDRTAGCAARWLCLRFCIYHFAFIISVATAAHDTPINPDDPAYLRRQYAWFQAQDPARQQQLRKLHADFQNLMPEDQARLTKVMQGYNAWLARLPEVDRERVLAAPTAAERLEEVRRLRERDWVDSLPKVYRDEYAALDVDARRQRVQDWRTEEAERREEWSLAQKHWAGNPAGKIPPFFLQENQEALDTFVGRLRENLNEFERKHFDETRAAAKEYGVFVGYAMEIVRLADAHPLLPWSKVGPHDWKELSDDVKKYLRENNAQRFTNEPRDMKRLQGRWPEYAWELANYCAKNDLKLPMPLGDCRKDQMPADVTQFLQEKLEPALKKTEAGRADLKALDEAQGKWPDYPRLIMDLARKQNLTVPGWSLPGALQFKQFWDNHRMPKKGK
ncbi:MAG TPA: hypothetical protein VHR66_19415 [Gemmataceae bacterium]|jgi:hypothetical protein|nr:hypothetical protein [Gemmataceae bacterium]